MHILLSANALSDVQAARIVAEAERDGWATVQRLPQAAPELPDALNRADVVVGWADARALAASLTVSTYLCGSAGFDAYQGHGLDRRPGFRFANAAGTMSVPIAEHLLAQMFALAREIPRQLRHQAARVWERHWSAAEITGSRACVAGLGGSGTELARRLQALGVSVVGVRRETAQGHPFADAVFPPERLAEAVAGADHVFNVLPGGPATRHLFNARVFAAMPPGACFYTASRGSVTDEAALVAALQSGHLGGAGLDVFEVEPLPDSSPLWDMANVLISSHTAGWSRHVLDRLTDGFVENLANLRAGRPLRNLVAPEALR